MSTKGLTGFVDGYRAGNLASTEQQFGILLPGLESKVKQLLVETKKLKDDKAVQLLTNLLSSVQSMTLSTGRVKEFSSQFIEYLSHMKSKDWGEFPPQDLITAIARDIISVAESSENEEVLSFAIQLAYLLK